MATIYTLALTSDAATWEGNTFRVMCPITGGAQDRVRVKFEAALSGNGFHVDHASIGIWTGSDSDTTAIPTELLFSGGHGFVLNASQVIISDWTAFTGFTASDFLIVIFDISATGGDPRAGPLSGIVTRSHAAAASYNSASTPPGSSGWADFVFGVSLIETSIDMAMPSVGTTNIRRINRVVAC